MGRNKKKAAIVEGSSDSDADEVLPVAAPQPAVSAAVSSAPEAAQPTTTTSSGSANPQAATKWVEVVKSDKKKPTTFVRGLAAHGLKLPATAAQLKKLVGPCEVVKGADDCLELHGDVTAEVRQALVGKLSIPKEVITADAAKSMAGGDDADADASDADDEIVVTRQEAIVVNYCPICSFPAEMCEYSGVFEKCKPWLMEQLAEEEAALLADATEKGRKRKVITEAERLENLLEGKGKKKIDKIIVLDCKTRSGKKRVTTVRGLDLFGINLTDISREFKKVFSCGAGITEEPGVLPCVEIQGDVVSQLCDLLPAKYGIPPESVYYMDGKTRVAAHAKQ